MQTAVSTKLLTAEEVFEIPQNDQKTELVRGVLIEMPPTGRQHGIIAGEFNRILGNHVKENRLGVVCTAETGFTLQHDPDIVRGPDVSFVSNERIPNDVDPVKYWNIAPDLAVEVISPTDKADDVLEKIIEYLQAGTKAVWVVHPKTKTVSVYKSTNEIQLLMEHDELDGEDVVPGFSCKLSEIFV